MKEKKYIGLEKDLENGITPSARIILDAKVFGLISDDEQCEGWLSAGINSLYDKVTDAWHPYGHLPSRLPEDLKERHARLFGDAIKIAKAHGWDPDAEMPMS